MVALLTLLTLPLLAGSVEAQGGGRRPVEVGSEGLVVRAAGEAFLLRVNARAVYDSRLFLDEAAPGVSDALFLRRAVVGGRVVLFGDYDARLNLDFTSGRPEPLEVSAGVDLGPALQVRAGKVRVPVGLGRQQGMTSVPFAESGLPNALSPGRAVGLELRGTLGGMVDYTVGAFDGVEDGATGELAWPDDPDLAGRGILRPFAARAAHPLQGLGVGLGGSFGHHRGTADEPGLATHRTPGRELFFRHLEGDTAVLADGLRRRISPQAFLYSGSFGLLAEYIVSTGELRRGTDTARLSTRAWQLFGSWVLTGEPAAFAGVSPVAPLDPRAGRWGALELALRADGLALDDDAFPRFGDPLHSSRSAGSYTAALNWHPTRAVRFVVDYRVTRFAAAPAGGSRRAEQLLLSRLQLSF